METSFLSEHSVEYILVPKFHQILSQKFSTVIPIYFWATREGNKSSLESNKDEKFFVVAMYARRPKIGSQSKNIIVKFNDILFRRARYFNKEGILVFAGVPHAKELLEFQMDVGSSWFHLVDGVEGYSVIDSESGRLLESCDSHGPLLDNQILEIIDQNYRSHKFEEIIRIIRDAQKNDINSSNNWIFNFESYKPVYFLCKI